MKIRMRIAVSGGGAALALIAGLALAPAANAGPPRSDSHHGHINSNGRAAIGNMSGGRGGGGPWLSNSGPNSANSSAWGSNSPWDGNVPWNGLEGFDW
ncbi:MULTISPECIES: hypothetical protein [Bacteria]|uniref:hypothetical protein n=1 Tax=Bacteria TaxID=2 RepID=UPI003C7C896E